DASPRMADGKPTRALPRTLGRPTHPRATVHPPRPPPIYVRLVARIHAGRLIPLSQANRTTQGDDVTLVARRADSSDDHHPMNGCRLRDARFRRSWSEGARESLGAEPL